MQLTLTTKIYQMDHEHECAMRIKAKYSNMNIKSQ